MKKGVGIFVVAILAIILLIFATKVYRAPSAERKETQEELSIVREVSTAKATKSQSSATKPQSSMLEASSRLSTFDLTPSTSIEQLRADAADAMGRKAYDKARDMLEAVMAQTLGADEKMLVGMDLYECLVRTYEYEKALALGKELLTLSPSPEERLKLNQQLAALLHRMGRSGEAEDLLNQAKTAETDSSMQAKYEAQIRSIWRHTDGRTAEVVSNLTVQVDANPNDEEALKQLGAIYLKSRRDYEAAMPVYEQLAALKPDDPEVQGALLNIYRETHRFDKIREVYETRLEQSAEDDPTLRFQIAQTELQAGKGDDAVAYAEEHLSGEEATPFELQMLSSVYDKAGRKEQALDTLSTAIERSENPQQKVSMQFQKADMLIWNKQYTEAEALLRAIRDANKDDKQTVSRVNSELIRIYQMRGKMGEIEL